MLIGDSDGLARGDFITGEFRQLKSFVRVESLSLSVDGRMIATGEGGGTINLWDAKSLEIVATLLGHTESITSLAWSPGGEILASHSSGDGTVRLWDIATRQELGIIDDASAPDLKLLFSPDGSILAGHGGEPMPQVVLWQAPRDEIPSH